MEDKVVVGEREFVIGKPTPGQVAGVTRIFARLSIGAKSELKQVEKPSELDYVMAILANVDEDTLITLAALSVGCDKKYATENFDLVWVTQALGILIRKSNLATVITNFTSIMSPMDQPQE